MLVLKRFNVGDSSWVEDSSSVRTLIRIQEKLIKETTVLKDRLLDFSYEELLLPDPTSPSMLDDVEAFHNAYPVHR